MLTRRVESLKHTGVTGGEAHDSRVHCTNGHVTGVDGDVQTALKLPRDLP